jgi:hypothetical protein
MIKKPIFTLHEISEWAEKDLVTLPTVQRGFVWRPFQIENLWDSLLRGYPIGAFVLSPKESNGFFELLDGQQRATAICLGFGNETFRDSQDKIKVFIDLEKPKGEDNRKYMFRVITQSHPWGYRKTDNTKALTSENIRKAMFLYEIDDHLAEDNLDRFFPFDASLPIPFSLFIEAALKNSKTELKQKIKDWPHWKKTTNQWNEKVKSIQSDIAGKRKTIKDLPELSSDKKIFDRIDEIFETVKNILDIENGQKIPALYLDFDKLTKQIQAIPEDESGHDVLNEENDNLDFEEENDQSTDEIENLFIRLNAGGTPLRGEELNYSILKAKISSDLQEKIEVACKGFLKSSRFITLAYRLFQHAQNQDNRDALTMRIKPKQFQKTVSVNLTEFEGFLTKILSKKKYTGKTLIEYSRYLMEYEENINAYGLPYLAAAKISDIAPEVMFLFLYRIFVWNDSFVFGSVQHRKMIGMLTLFIWLGKGEKQRDHAKLLSNVWPCAKTLKKELFWSSSTVQRAMLNGILTPFPTFDSKNDKTSLIHLRKYQAQSNKDIKVKFGQDTNYGTFVKKMFYNRDLILYAQRTFLSKVFKVKQYQLDDTNVPFDWDHISPHRFVHRKFKIPFVIKQWYSTNGNMRAWPYSLNRMDQDDVPALKLDPLNYKQYGESDSDKFAGIENNWNHYIKKHQPLIQKSSELKKSLLEWSFCQNEWAVCRVRDMKTGWKEVYHLILERNLSICQEWYKQLHIEDLIPSEIAGFSFPNFIDSRKWDSNPAYEVDSVKIFQADDSNFWVSKPFSVGESDVYLYFSCSANPNFALEEGGVEFGIFEKNPGSFISKIEISDKSKLKYETNKKNWIFSNFTLVSQDEVSYLGIFNNFKDWLKTFPKKDIRDLEEPFINSVLTKYRSKLNS